MLERCETTRQPLRGGGSPRGHSGRTLGGDHSLFWGGAQDNEETTSTMALKGDGTSYRKYPIPPGGSYVPVMSEVKDPRTLLLPKQETNGDLSSESGRGGCCPASGGSPKRDASS